MKNYKIFIIAIVLISLGACKKYEEGPSFTLLSPSKRITGTWDLKETAINDSIINLNDIPSLLGSDTSLNSTGLDFDFGEIKINKINLIFEKDGEGEFAFNVSVMFYPFSWSEKLEWNFDEEKDNVSITMQEETQEFRIIKLTKKELWLLKTEEIENRIETLSFKFDKVPKN
ncbi:MAG: hypothetical protein GX879_10560 [Bacteroidales bacterium]|nr:hypothetical protein [Bacteroidales bacterium]